MGPAAAEVMVATGEHDAEPFVVDFEYPNDPRIPQNWPLLKRIYVMFILSVLNMIGTIASSIMGPAQDEVAQQFGVNHEISVLCTTLFLVVRLASFIS